MIEIPEQLASKAIVYCKVAQKDKKPFEPNWQNTPYDSEQLNDWLKTGGNYGVLCGYNGLVVIDCDEPEIDKVVAESLPPTLTVKTGSGGSHYYYISPDITKKIVLKDTKGKHYGEIQTHGTQVVGPGSIHPNGNTYEIVNSSEITTIESDKLLHVLRDYIKELNEIPKSHNKKENDINEIPITDIMNTTGFNSRDGEIYGSNPWHGSQGGANTWINTSKNVGYCFRCNSSITPVKAIALNTGIINSCSDYLDKDQFMKVLKEAQDNYGLTPRKQTLTEDMLLITNYETNVEIFWEKQPFFYDKSKQFWVWKQNKWCLSDDIDMLNEIDNSVKLSGSTCSQSMKTAYLNAFKKIGRKKIPENLPPQWIQFNNTIIDLETGQKMPVTPKYFFCNPIPWELGETEETPTIDTLFKEWAGEDKELLYEIMAYSMIPDYPIHRLFCFIGSGLNGKSTYLELLKRFVGVGNCTSTELDDLINRTFEITKLHKKLVCIMGETNFAEMSKTSKIKKLTGGDMIGFEYKNKTPFDDKNYAKIIIATNNLPSTTDKTDGFYRRWVIVDFANRFSEKRDVLGEIPDEEYPNLALKCVNVLKRLLSKREFAGEGSIEERRAKYEEKSNPFEKFWKENIADDCFDDYITKRQFKKQLDVWCKDHRFREINDRVIAKFMIDKGIEGKRVSLGWKNDHGEEARGMAWVGIKWK